MHARGLTWTLPGEPLIPSGRWIQVLYVLADAALILLNGVAVFFLRFGADVPTDLLRGKLPSLPPYPFRQEYLAFLLLYGVLTLLLFQGQELYRTARTRSALDETLAVFKAVLAATLLLMVFIYLSNIKIISRLVVGGSAVLNVVILAAWRLCRRRVVERRLAQGIGTRNVLIVGAGKVGQALASYLEANKRLGFVVKGFLDENHSSDPRLLGKIEELSRVARAAFVDDVFITIPSAHEVVRRVALEARRQRLDVKVIPELYDGLGWRAPLEYMGDIPVMSLHREPIPVLGLLVKRTLDVVAALASLLVLSPLFLLLALAIRLDSPGPVFYRSVRVGRRGRRFTCYKFRSMVADADGLKAALRPRNERQGPFFKIAHDPRVTRLGAWLRKCSLDELPQLWNVLKGDMSLVGPRPHPTDDFDQYSLEHLRRLDVTPGITGLWQVSARRDPSFERNMALDLEYIENWNLWLDLRILLRTIPAVLLGGGE